MMQSRRVGLQSGTLREEELATKKQDYARSQVTILSKKIDIIGDLEKLTEPGHLISAANGYSQLASAHSILGNEAEANQLREKIIDALLNLSTTFDQKCAESIKIITPLVEAIESATYERTTLEEKLVEKTQELVSKSTETKEPDKEIDTILARLKELTTIIEEKSAILEKPDPNTGLAKPQEVMQLLGMAGALRMRAIDVIFEMDDDRRALRLAKDSINFYNGHDMDGFGERMLKELVDSMRSPRGRLPFLENSGRHEQARKLRELALEACQYAANNLEKSILNAPEEEKELKKQAFLELLVDLTIHAAQLVTQNGNPSKAHHIIGSAIERYLEVGFDDAAFRLTKVGMSLVDFEGRGGVPNKPADFRGSLRDGSHPGTYL